MYKHHSCLLARPATPTGGARGQSGISLIIVLIGLAIMSLAAVGLIRSVDTGALVVGNLAFKQGASSTADSSAEAAMTWLTANMAGTTLYTDSANSGYYASSLTTLDITGNSSSTARSVIDWDSNSCAHAAAGTSTACITPAAATTANGYTTRYLIARMCNTTGDPNASGNTCAKPVASSSTESPKKGELKYGEDKRFAAVSGPYFRIIVRSVGPRNTVSYTESYVHF
jgi:type IV pilus assembly protein PilX